MLSTAVAAIAGILSGLSGTIAVTDAFGFTIYALIVAIIGGVRSVRGAVLAGVLLGLIVQYAYFFIGSYVASLIVFLSAVAVLLVRPEVIS